MQNVERLTQLLEVQNMYFEDPYTTLEQEKQRREGIYKDRSRLEEYVRKTNENAKKIVEATKTYLIESPFIYTSTIKNSLLEFNRKIGRDVATGAPLSPTQGGKTILLYHHDFSDALPYFSTPVYDLGRLVRNPHFAEDPDLGYLLLSRGLEEIVKKKVKRFPHKFELKYNPIANTKGINFNTEGKISAISVFSKELIVYMNRYSKMMLALSNEFDRWIAGTESGENREDLLFKKVEKEDG